MRTSPRHRGRQPAERARDAQISQAVSRALTELAERGFDQRRSVSPVYDPPDVEHEEHLVGCDVTGVNASGGRLAVRVIYPEVT